MAEKWTVVGRIYAKELWTEGGVSKRNLAVSRAAGLQVCLAFAFSTPASPVIRAEYPACSPRSKGHLSTCVRISVVVVFLRVIQEGVDVTTQANSSRYVL